MDVDHAAPESGQRFRAHPFEVPGQDDQVHLMQRKCFKDRPVEIFRLGMGIAVQAIPRNARRLRAPKHLRRPVVTDHHGRQCPDSSRSARVDDRLHVGPAMGSEEPETKHQFSARSRPRSYIRSAVIRPCPGSSPMQATVRRHIRQGAQERPYPGLRDRPPASPIPVPRRKDTGHADPG